MSYPKYSTDVLFGIIPAVLRKNCSIKIEFTCTLINIPKLSCNLSSIQLLFSGLCELEIENTVMFFNIFFHTLLTTTGHYWSTSRVSTSPTVTDGQGKTTTSWRSEVDSNSLSLCRDKLDCSRVCDSSSPHDHEASLIGWLVPIGLTDCTKICASRRPINLSYKENFEKFAQ